ncbi:hypothetical protein CCACVL1_28507 [Corchorus capsularis]|uniref:Uncharacterized protein n=1 Tax=Corchorus capsularis TaxID=210143 RepID=A0A1R3G699_COCAP|nr:hypothetical protein CCACVL1_28507 [Corchorus capsularis]
MGIQQNHHHHRDRPRRSTSFKLRGLRLRSLKPTTSELPVVSLELPR